MLSNRLSSSHSRLRNYVRKFPFKINSAYKKTKKFGAWLGGLKLPKKTARLRKPKI